MLLLFLVIECKQASPSRIYDQSTSKVSGVTDHHLRNTEELKNHVSYLLQGYDNINNVLRKAQFSSINKIEYRFNSSGYSVNQQDFIRTFTLTTTLLRSIKNTDGSYDVRYSKVVTTKNMYQKLDRMNELVIKLAQIPELTGRTDYEIQCELKRLNSMSKSELSMVFNEMISTANTYKANTIKLFKLD